MKFVYSAPPGLCPAAKRMEDTAPLRHSRIHHTAPHRFADVDADVDVDADARVADAPAFFIKKETAPPGLCPGGGLCPGDSTLIHPSEQRSSGVAEKSRRTQRCGVLPQSGYLHLSASICLHPLLLCEADVRNAGVDIRWDEVLCEADRNADVRFFYKKRSPATTWMVSRRVQMSIRLRPQRGAEKWKSGVLVDGVPAGGQKSGNSGAGASATRVTLSSAWTSASPHHSAPPGLRQSRIASRCPGGGHREAIRLCRSPGGAE
jgi:hypothetical protein